LNITELSIKNSRVTVLGIVFSIIMGLVTYLNYPSAEDPTIVIRNAIVTAQYPGMSAVRVEDLITEPLENTLRSIAEIDEITSTSKTGQTRIEVSIHDWVTDLDAVFQDIRNKVGDAKSDLPPDTKGPQVNDDYGLTAIATIALWADGFSMAEMHEVAKDMRKTLYTLDGVKRIEFYGIQEERIFLEMKPSEIANLGLSPEELFGQLIAQNVIKPGGSLRIEGKSIVLEPTGAFDTVQQIKDVVYNIPNTNQVARLGDVVNVERRYVDPPESPAFFNGRPSIILSLSTVEGTNNVQFGDELTSLLDNIQNELPIGYVIDYATYQPELIDIAVNGAVSNVYQTLAIVLVVVMVFLGLRTGFIVGFFVPLTMLMGIIIMRLLEIELQRMSIAAMIIALGLLVDNGIVVAEDIRVRMENGAKKFAASVEAGRTLALPLLVSSLTTIFAFMPMMLLEGSSGDYVRSLSQVVAILLLTSWVLSMTVTPSMSVWFMKSPPQGKIEKENYTGAFYDIYRNALSWLLGNRIVFIGILVALFVGSIQVLGLVRTEFFPLGERNQFVVNLDFETGTNQEEVQELLQPISKWLADTEQNPEIRGSITYVGNGGPRFFLALSPVEADPHRGFMVITTFDPDQVDAVVDRVNSYLLDNLPQARADAKKMWFGATEPGQIEVRLVGPDSRVLSENALTVMSAFHDIQGTVGISQDWENKVPKLYVNVDQVLARRAGVTSSDVAESLNTAFNGTTLSDFREGDKSIPIVLRANEDMRKTFKGLQQVLIYSPTSQEFITVDQVARVEARWEYAKIKRKDQQRTLTVQARNVNLSSKKLLEAIQPTIDGLQLPAGYKWEIGGEVEDQGEANEKLFGLLPLAFGGIFILIIGQFNSFRRGGIILATIPLMMIGGVAGLVIMNAAYGFMVMLGFFSLAGILINNGIVLIDRIEIERRMGKEPLDSVISACLARFRPILMTMLTTVLGLIPLILFGGALFYGMASVIAFGLIVATIITLGFVPVMYTLLFKIPVNKENVKSILEK
jgi:multidrug efflux pump